MRLKIISVSRRPPWPLWAVGVVLLWLSLVAVSVGLSVRAGQHVSLCLFKHLTGLPCPTCGLTRGFLAAMHGDFLGGWLFNPLFFSVIILFALDALMRMLFGKVIRPQLSRRGRIAVWSVVAAAFAANWIYVILFVG